MGEVPRPPAEPDFEGVVREAEAKVRGEGGLGPEVGNKAEGPVLTRPIVVGPLLLLFLAVMSWNLKDHESSLPSLTQLEETVFLPVSLFTATQSIEAFRQEHGRLPRNLEEAGLPAEAFRFELSGDTYLLTAVGSHRSETFSSEGGMDGLLKQMEEAVREGGL